MTQVKTRITDTKDKLSLKTERDGYVVKEAFLFGERMDREVGGYYKEAKGKIRKEGEYQGSVLGVMDIYAWGSFNKTTTVSNIYEKKFVALSAKWKEQTGSLSNPIKIIKNQNYLSIIDIGEPFIPFILKDLQESYDSWFSALEQITKENPVPDEDFGDIEKMTERWLAWGKENNKI